MKTQDIFEILKKRLEEGMYPPGSKFPSEIALTEEFRVSKVTVNKLVSRLVEQDYLIRGIRGAGTHVRDLVCRSRGSLAFISRFNTYTMRILQGFQQECLHSRFYPVVFSPESEELPFCLNLLNSKNILGIVSVGYGNLRVEKDVPFIALDYNLPFPSSEQNLVRIDSDNYSGGKQMMREILRRGHRQIAIFSSERFTNSTDAPVTSRVRGFHDALSEAGFGSLIRRTFYGMPGSLADAKSCLNRILRDYPETSIVCTDSDPSAELFSSAAESMGVSCPGKIALTGFGNVTRLKIATVNQDPERQGQLAVRYIKESRNSSALFRQDDWLVETSLVNVEYIPICTNIQ